MWRDVIHTQTGDYREEQADDDQPGRTLAPLRDGCIQVKDVENQRRDKKSVGDRSENALDHLCNRRTVPCSRNAHQVSPILIRDSLTEGGTAHAGSMAISLVFQTTKGARAVLRSRVAQYRMAIDVVGHRTAPRGRAF